MDQAGEAIEGGRVIPARIPDEKTFLEAKQDLLPYITDRSTPRGPSNVHSDQGTIQRMIAAEGYKLRPDLLTRYLVHARSLPEDVAASISQRLAKGKSVRLKEFNPNVGKDEIRVLNFGRPESSPKVSNRKVNLEQFLRDQGGNPYNAKDRADLVDTARKSWQDKGYTGLKYLNTSPRETEFATDPTSYIVFDPKHTRSRFAQFNPADAESSDLLKSHGGPVHMGKGGLLKAGAEELVELAAKYLPKAEKVIPHGDPQQANLYHVTFSDNVSKIKEKGINPIGGGSSNWVKGKTQKRYQETPAVYAFNNPKDALVWASKMEYEFKKPISILKTKFNDSWVKDPSEDFSLTQYGKALKTNSVVKPDNISGVTDFSAIPKARGTDMNFDEWISHHGKEIEKTILPVRKASGGLSRVNESGN